MSWMLPYPVNTCSYWIQGDSSVWHREQYHGIKVVSYCGYGHNLRHNKILSTLRSEYIEEWKKWKTQKQLREQKDQWKNATWTKPPLFSKLLEVDQKTWTATSLLTWPRAQVPPATVPSVFSRHFLLVSARCLTVLTRCRTGLHCSQSLQFAVLWGLTGYLKSVLFIRLLAPRSLL